MILVSALTLILVTLCRQSEKGHEVDYRETVKELEHREKQIEWLKRTGRY